LPPHKLEVFFTDGTVDGSERDGLVLAHPFFLKVGEGDRFKVRICSFLREVIRKAMSEPQMNTDEHG
jgi:hypothetical protein